ncbi:MAG TPA: hypothetical protein EYP30_06270 [Archaeoglobaceae archaeon]|nr:hypothetical protein [Archaeoglobaceae archaeon]
MRKLGLFFVLNRLKDIKIFTTADFQRIFNLNYQAAKKAIYRYKKTGVFTEAKKGLYFLTQNSPPEFEIANRVYCPSYVSFETALSFYGVIPESIYEVISATPKISRNFIINDLVFSYKKIKRDYFFGYITERIQERTILIAEPEKALLDYLYFVILKRRSFTYERINLQKKIKKQKLFRYARIFNNRNLLKLLTNLYAQF